MADNPVKLLVKLPVPVPSVVLLLLIVGFDDDPQQTPFAIIVPPPSEVIFPPETAEDEVIEVAAVVVSVGAIIAVVEIRNELMDRIGPKMEEINGYLSRI